MKPRYAYIVYIWFRRVDEMGYKEVLGVCTSRKAAINLMETFIRIESRNSGKDWIEEDNGHNWRYEDQPIVNIISVEGPDMKEAVLQCDRYTMLSFGKPRTKRQRRKKSAGEQMRMPL